MRVHVIGVPGSGKTTLASWVRESFGVPAFDLDWVVYDREAGERPPVEIAGCIDEIRGLDGWATEGAYRQRWITPLLDDADAIVWLDFGLTTCATRILKRHVVAELGRNNQHPGWRKLATFLNYTRRTAAEQRAGIGVLLAGYERKTWRCRSSKDVTLFKASVSR